MKIQCEQNPSIPNIAPNSDIIYIILSSVINSAGKKSIFLN